MTVPSLDGSSNHLFPSSWTALLVGEIILWILGLIVAAILISSPLIWRFVYMPVVNRILDGLPAMKAVEVDPAPGGEDCEFQVDGHRLRGVYWKTPADQRQGVVVFCHELTGDRWLAGPYTERLRESGFDVLAFDFRSHGESDAIPGYEVRPWVTRFELADVQAAVEYAMSRPDADPRGVGLFGVSRGGAAVLCSAALLPQVRCVLVDGLVPTEAMLLFYLQRFMSIYSRLTPIYSRVPAPYLTLLMWWALRRTESLRGCRYVRTTPLMKRVRCPAMLIHGRNDSYVPPPVIEWVHARCLPKADVWYVPGARHNQAVFKSPEAYHNHVEGFFRKCLAPAQNAPLS